ncbi:hypothetical protein [Hymenobacter cellulosilyticus]|uniref:Bulb-type lectin domain-containing protein n=1 Tax=Hymenobacter cellulosilyticus TaxID=2932248 RepID=A0A8T9QE03_9BACT|nr:hypothetical protein [Hymenobacter cellulosilyticus]UOQ75122.1 hypothetical protein MUN79_29040 [Hymenobacter cellulosilyticus]
MNSILPTSDGGFLLVGVSTSGATGDKTQPARGGLDYWVVKVDANGTKLWDKTFGGPLPDVLLNAAPTPMAGIYSRAIQHPQLGTIKPRRA